MNKNRETLYAFYDELNKSAGFVSRALSAIWRTAKNPKVQSKVKSKVVEHADDIALATAGGAGAAYLYNRKSDDASETPPPKITTTTETPDSTRNIVTPIEPTWLDSLAGPNPPSGPDLNEDGSLKVPIHKLTYPTKDTLKTTPPVVDTLTTKPPETPTDSTVVEPPVVKKKPPVDTEDFSRSLYGRINTVKDSIDENYGKSIDGNTTKNKDKIIIKKKPPVTTNTDAKVDSLLDALKKRYEK